MLYKKYRIRILLLMVFLISIFCLCFNSSKSFASSVSKTYKMGDKLKGTDRILYDKLKEYTSEVADGKRVSTVFEVSLDDLGLSDKKWTASDLGVDTVITDGKINEDAAEALYSQIEIDYTGVLDCLVHDCPYELFWFDKTSGVSSSMPRYMAETDGKTEYMYFISGPSHKFSVADEYSSGNMYEVTESAVRKAAKAKSKAAAIVKKYAGVSDYEKLKGYKKEICSLTEYNDDAVGGKVSYGNPWQLIWVFDGDTSTNVVCEGYAKAFKYLCDLTDFSKDIACIIVSGTMKGGTGEGSHAWNIVKMPDGSNYLVDVANCDTGAVGYDDKLFLAGTSGSVSNGYVFRFDDYNIVSFKYDSTMKEKFGSSRLTINGINYETGVKGSSSVSVKKANQPMKVTVKTKTVKLKTVKMKKAVVSGAVKVSKAKGTVTYKKVNSGSDKYLSIAKKTGKITVKKKTPKGTWKIKVKVTASGNKKYKKGSKTVIVKVKVR